MVFAPFLLTFVWLNSILAKTIWKRRDSDFQKENEISTVSGKIISKEVKERRLRRKQRTLRMFKTIIILMLIFIVCRVPNWVFLVFMMSDNPKENIHWILHFVFGLMVVFNCMLNPFLFTFLTETMKLTSYLSENCRKFLKVIQKNFK